MADRCGFETHRETDQKNRGCLYPGILDFLNLSTLPSALRASGEFLNGGSQYTVSGNSHAMRQHTTAGSDFRFV
jgi:hypothetical protein